MKKIITLLLVLALMVPMCLVANADAAKKPFQAVTWSKPISGYSNIENLYRINISMQGSFVRMGSLVYGSYTDADVTAMAESMKKDMNARPEGQRYIHFFGPAYAMELIENAIYMDEPAKQLTEMCEAFFAKYYEIGGKVEGAMMSMLYPDMGAYYITQALGSDKKLLGKIVNDPRYKTEIRPLLEERGFQFYEGNLTDYTPEIYGITGKAGSQYSTCQSIWTTVMKNRLNEFIRDWAYAPMAKYFPDVHVSDYQSTDTDARLKPVSTDGGVIGAYSGDGYRAGNTSSDKYYSNTPNDEFYGKVSVSYKNLPTYMGTTYRQTSFNNFKFDMNTAKQAYWSDPEHAVCFWVNAYRSTEDKNNNVNNSPYYAEQVYHLNMYDPKPFVVFTGDDLVGDNLTKAITIANDLLTELTRVVGYADRKPIGTAIDWNSEFMLSGMYANGKNYWRISPNRDMVSKEAFKTNAKDPTFYVNGQTVSFPGGKILSEGVTSVPTCGYWVETASNVTPVIKSDANRFEKYPAYVENFESYANGTKLQAANVRDLNGWTIKGNDLLITSDGKDKALSLTGNATLENKQIPGNVTVADSYAKKQSWEVTVTIPEGMSADAKITLLSYKADGTEIDDGGFMIKGGKLYYGTGEEDENWEHIYKELTTLTPGTYTLRRDMNFGQTFYCNYSVISGGKTLKTAEKVKIPAFDSKVKTISIKSTGMNVKLLLDDYTLRATSAAADLSLYTTELGLKETAGAKLTESVNYRLSWANASAQKETATVKADITSGGKTTTKTLKTVTLDPGSDGVEYGAVELKSGESAKVYLETTIKDEKVQLAPGTNATTPTQGATQETKAPTKATVSPSRMTLSPSKATQATQPTAQLGSTPTKPVATQATEVTEVTQATVATEATQATVAPAATEATQETKTTQATQPENTDKTNGDQKKGPNVILIVVIVVVVLAGAGVGAYFLLKKKKV